MKAKAQTRNVGEAGKPAKAAAVEYEAALVSFKAAKQARDKGLEVMEQTRRELEEVRRELTKAVSGEDFDKAAELKQKREALERMVSREARGLLEKAVQDAAKALAGVYFEKHGEHRLTSTVTVTRVAVVNPETHHSAEVTYLDSSDSVSLSLDGKSFDSEAWHLESWATEKGFLIYANKVSVEV